MQEARRATVLVVDDVPSIIRLLELELGMHGFVTAGCQVGEPAFEAIEKLRPDVIILELLLPGMSGLDMLVELKKRYDIPVLILTTMDSEADRVQAFDLGADDFIRKPFDPEELGRRVGALIGRTHSQRRVLNLDDLNIDLTRQVARRGEAIISLTTNEWAVLLALAAEPGRGIPLASLAILVGGDYTASHIHTLTHMIDRLRHNLEPDPANPRVILGDPESGYTLAVDIHLDG